MIEVSPMAPLGLTQGSRRGGDNGEAGLNPWRWRIGPKDIIDNERAAARIKAATATSPEAMNREEE
jgi:hypothetical protein